MDYTQFNPRLLPILLGLGVMIIFVAVGHLIKPYYLQKKKNAFIYSGNPGETLLRQMNCLNLHTPLYFCLIIIILVIVSGVLLYSFHFISRDWITIENSFFMLIGAFWVVYFLFKLFQKILMKKKIRLSYEGDLKTGLELQKLKARGYHVFHNFHAGKFIIDHIIISSKGIFTVKTNASSKCPSRNRADECPVVYNGHALHFPKHTDLKTVDKAREQAIWFSNWLSDSVGELLAARAIVSIPGWLIKRTTREGIPVVNPGQFDSLFEHINPRPLETNMIQKMVHQIETKYRSQPVTEGGLAKAINS